MAFQRKKQKKELPPLKQQIFANWNGKSSRKDRIDFPKDIVEELIQEAGGLCQCGCGRPDTQTHHVMPRTRGGRGVKTNGMRVNGICNTRMHDNEDELQYWIAEYERRHGPNFWFDEQDWDEHYRKQKQVEEFEQAYEKRKKQFDPVVTLLSKAAGRKLTKKEIRAINAMVGTKYLESVTKLAEDIAAQAGARKEWGYGRFED